jgi:hypothetical protein
LKTVYTGREGKDAPHRENRKATAGMFPRRNETREETIRRERVPEVGGGTET